MRRWSVQRNVPFSEKTIVGPLPAGMQWCMYDSEAYRSRYKDDPNALVMDLEALNADVIWGTCGGDAGVNADGRLVMEIWDDDHRKHIDVVTKTVLTEIADG